MVKKFFLMNLVIFLWNLQVFATDYFVHPNLGKDTNSGLTKIEAFKTLARATQIKFLPGDRLLLASGETYYDIIEIKNTQGTANKPIIIKSILWNSESNFIPAKIDFKGKANGILIEDSSFIHVMDLQLTADGFHAGREEKSNMRCGILVTNKHSKQMTNILIKNISIYDVYYENAGFKRGESEVRTANGTQKYGWGIRVINNNGTSKIEKVTIEDCTIKSVAHTGIKLTGTRRNISNITISNNIVEATGGPGIQMSEVKDIRVNNNHVSHSGSYDDSRKWGRGSGLWTWSASNVLIEHNKFLYANGPGDSAGAHIDFNCDNIVIQYNLSAYNAGGFCEILGNNYNCIYRYNISINDGHRVKGENGAFQEGKILWLSGYQGEKKERKGPVNSYIYNNTIYSDSSVVAKIAIDNTSNGIFIFNNIFYLEGETKAVLGDQYKPDVENGKLTENVIFQNNLFLNTNSWPTDISLKDSKPLFGDPKFFSKGGLNLSDYTPINSNLIKNSGISIPIKADNPKGILSTLILKTDILGNTLEEVPSIGAIVPSN